MYICRCINNMGTVPKKFHLLMKLCPLHCLPRLQSLPWQCNCSAGGAAVLIQFLLGQIVPSHSWHCFPVTCLLLRRIALEIPSACYTSEEMGNFNFSICKSLCQVFWFELHFMSLILFLMTSSTTLICLAWVHAFQMEVMGIDSCCCWGRWQAVHVQAWCPELCHSHSCGDSRLWPGAFGSASTPSPSLAVLVCGREQ